MSLLDRIRDRGGSDLPDSEINAMIDAIAAEIDAYAGPVGPVTIELGDATDPDTRGVRTLRLPRAIVTSAGPVTITEMEPGNSGAMGDTVELLPQDYRVLHGGLTLQRLSTGPNGRSHWAPLVRITYTPAGPNAAQRDEVLVKLMLLDLSYRGLIKSERAGDYQWSGSLSSDSYGAERAAILASLGAGRSGLMMA